MSSVYQNGSGSLSGLPSFEVPRGMNTKRATGRLRYRQPSFHLPNKQRRQKQQRRARGRNPKRGNRADGVKIQTHSGTQVGLSWMPIFPSYVKKRLTYYEGIQLSNLLFAPANYVYSANGLYDPNITGTGHQPDGFDQMMLFYNHYVVTSAKITVNFRNTSATYPMTVAISVNSSPTAITDAVRIAESGYVVRDTIGILGSGANCKTLSMTCDMSRYSGIPVLRDAPEYRGDVSNNPTEQTYFNVSSWELIGNNNTVTCEVLIEYTAWFIEPKKVTSSLQAAMHRLALEEEGKTSRPPPLRGPTPVCGRTS